MSFVLRERDDLAAAERCLSQGMELLLHGEMVVDADVVALGYLTHARLRHALGDTSGSLQALDEFGVLAQQRRFLPYMRSWDAALRARFLLAQGDLDGALRWAETTEAGDDAGAPFAFFREIERLALASIWIAQGRRDRAGERLIDALGLLGRLLQDAEAGARGHSIIAIRALQALAYWAQGNAPEALAALGHALTLAEPEGSIRSFADEGAPMAELLRAAHARGLAPQYVEKLLAAFPRTLNDERGTMKTQPAIHRSAFIVHHLVEPLTTRELEVLRLIAAGASNREIAEQLVITVGTVKRHINNLFGKLGVQSRTQAINKARTLDLL